MRRETFIKGVTIAFREEKIVRDMAQTVGLNVSDVCRRALRKELGIALRRDRGTNRGVKKHPQGNIHSQKT